MSKQPKYRQVADALRREIDNGDLPARGAAALGERAFSALRRVAEHCAVRAWPAGQQGLISSSQGLGYEVAKHEVFELNASRFENLNFPQNGDAYSTDVTDAGRRPHQTFRVEILPAPAHVAERLKVDAGSRTVLRFCHRYVDDVPWSTQATYYPAWLADEAPRLAEPGDIAEGTTRYLAAHGIEQIGYFDEISTRMPTPDEARLLEIGAGVPVLLWTRTGYSAGPADPVHHHHVPGRPEPDELRDRRPVRPKRERASVRIIPARPDDVSKLLAFREEAAAWLTRLGTDQWQRPYPADKLLATIEAGTVFMVWDGDATAATITLTPEAEAGLWTEQELSEPSLFVNKLTVARTHAGANVGGRLLDWAGDRAYRAGAKWLRLDAWTTNEGLQPYYLRQGFEHVRTVL